MRNSAHFFHYLALFLILLLGLVSFFAFRWQPVSQFVVILATVGGYVGWGITHHYLENRLSVGVVAEYLLVGLAVICLFWLNLLG
ncbi:hypothetical protein COT52_02775 [candidate division WWE3 bacterium CG08_land_8_20_14_0_20_43_13]|uniref:Uncharacterized protein n=1 Tax=candidate division WWE3 bacterium CG08_land_8_20_14_0_20_43_13 TaxID=1975087 RepID=A0A2H0X6U8_UNCKA|nr:MAG: hypothetical protein COT52_02775 [candidate division WWE3 bacterium CG08_land_8_20_14_0_20_43_13]